MKYPMNSYLPTLSLTRVFFVTLSLLLASCVGNSIDELRNPKKLDLPLSTEKLVIAHNMTNIIRYKGHKMEDSCDPEFYPPKGNITEPLGGLVQVNVMADRFLKDSTLEQTIRFELHAAKRCGIDGFQFYYPLRQRGPDDEIIKTYFKVADKENIDFKFTFCPSHPSGKTEKEKIADYARRINAILDEVGRDNPHWLRTPDGRLIIYLWYGEQIADIPEDREGKSEKYYVARAFKKLEDSIGEDVAWIYSINHEISEQELHEVLDYFPAVWMWTIPYTDNYVGKKVARICKERKRTFTGSVFSGFYTSKLLHPGTWDMYTFAADAVKAGIDHVERRGIITGLSYNFRKLFELAIAEDVPIVNVITWNDYPEGHHLAPEVNHNFGFSVLLTYYKNIWKGLPSPYADRDVAILFYKKYRHDIIPEPYNIPIVNIAEALPAAYEDSIEVVTLLREPAQVILNGKDRMVSAGLLSNKFDQKPGRVELKVMRRNAEVLNFFGPEWITDKPYRTDRMIYSYSSEFGNFYRDIFIDKPAIFSREYDRDSLEIKY